MFPGTGGDRAEGPVGEWMAGFGWFDITPPTGVTLTGYAGRPGPADRVLDRLHVRALAISDGEGPPVVLCSADLLGWGAEHVATIRDLLCHRVPRERLLLNCSHTHAGPTVAPMRAMGQPDPDYCRLLVRLAAAAAEEAVRAMQPARLAFGTAATGIGTNRRELRDGRVRLGTDPTGPYDPTVSVLRVEDAAGRPLACWFSHGTHPVVMGPSNTGISAEWPGAAADTASAALGCPALFAQGCCGDVNPIRRGEHEVARSVGRELAGAVLVAWERATPLERSGAAAALESVLLPLRKPSREEAMMAREEARASLRELEAQLAESPPEVQGPILRRREIARAMADWAEDYLAAALLPAEPAVRMDVQAIRLGDLAILATAAETFVEIGLCIRAASPLPRTVPLGYTNGCFGYLPTAAAFPKGGYEVDTAFKYYGTLMVTEACEDRTLDAASRLLRAVTPG